MVDFVVGEIFECDFLWWFWLLFGGVLVVGLIFIVYYVLKSLNCGIEFDFKVVGEILMVSSGCMLLFDLFF